jgi:hypothetical protein
MKNKIKSPAMKTEKAISTEPVKRTRTTRAKVVSPIQTEMTKLETAFMAAMTGQMKFKEVKSIFLEIHKEIKKSAKSKN